MLQNISISDILTQNILDNTISKALANKNYLDKIIIELTNNIKNINNMDSKKLNNIDSKNEFISNTSNFLLSIDAQ